MGTLVDLPDTVQTAQTETALVQLWT
jgi:hypothetical protein